MENAKKIDIDFKHGKNKFSFEAILQIDPSLQKTC